MPRLGPSGFGMTPRRVLVWGLVLVALATATAVGVALVQRVRAPLARGGAPEPPRITQQIAVERLQAVAKLVASEMTLRDVVIYEQTRFAATKRALLVVTGRVLAGVDLGAGADVRIDHDARRITVSLPPATVLGVDVVNVRTYDERAGLLNPFRPADRDTIQAMVRAQLVAAAEQSGILAHADRTAGELLTALLARDGYTVEILRPPVVRREER